MKIIGIFVFLAILCGHLGSTAGNTDDNEFAEFEDDFADSSVPDIPEFKEDKEERRAAPPVVEQKDEFEDEDFGVVDEQDEELEKTKDADSETDEQAPVQPLKFTDVPAHFRSNWASYQVEGIVVLVIFIYLLNYIIGKTTNSTIAHTIFDMCRPSLEEQFALVGDDGSSELDKLEPTLRRETDSVFSAWCTGRVNANSLFIQMKMIKRQDLVSRILDIFDPSYDKMTIKVSLEGGQDVDPMIFAVGEKKIASKNFKEMLDLNSFVSERKQAAQQFNLPATWQLYADQSEVVFSMLEPGVVSLLKRHEEAIEFIHISDQYTGPKPGEGETYTRLPEAQRIMFVSLNLKKLAEDEESVTEILSLVYYLIDKVKKTKLSKDAKVKAERRRKEFEDAFLKQTHQIRQEAAQARKEEKTRERKQKLMDENDPDRQKRLEAKELKREAKAKQPKMKQLKVK
ncbi:CBN-CCDC-47 protein [Caenorhabditis brenneri]|uniref:PAT complex subunit CCDC47 n=1 Tax=Caenorhabditis brenneri TaxID=135651 RepID=G0MBY8_CAEBE|nr:CBN-CCDC-47 protein [Caenorhabditis brenneri]